MLWQNPFAGPAALQWWVGESRSVLGGSILLLLIPWLPHDFGQVGFLWASTLSPPLGSHARILATHCQLPPPANLDEVCSAAILQKPQPPKSAGFLNSRVFCA